MQASALTPISASPVVTSVEVPNTHSSAKTATAQQSVAWTHNYEGAICQLEPDGPVTTDSIVRYPQDNGTITEGKTEWRHDAKDGRHTVITKIYGPVTQSGVSQEIEKVGITNDELFEVKENDSLLADLKSRAQQNEAILTLFKVDSMDGRGFEGYQFHLTDNEEIANLFNRRTAGREMSCTSGRLMEAFASSREWKAPPDLAVLVSE